MYHYLPPMVRLAIVASALIPTMTPARAYPVSEQRQLADDVGVDALASPAMSYLQVATEADDTDVLTVPGLPVPSPVVEPIATMESMPASIAPCCASATDNPKSLSQRVGSVGLEVAGLATAITATRVGRIFKEGPTFGFKSEGWFGRSTDSLGMDKLHHAYKTYVIADVLQGLISKRQGPKGAAAAGALISLGLMTYGELYDGMTKGHGWSNEDMTVHLAGAGFAVLRNTVPGLREKVDMRMLTMPTFRGKQTDLTNLLAQRKYLLAAQLSGFRKLEDTPLRYVELHFGYFGRGFTEKERAMGEPLRRRLFVGLGFNVQSLFSKKPQSRLTRLAKGALDYIQLPYTSIH
jgi:uncharacterized protein YfiM (DUF2279 family)